MVAGAEDECTVDNVPTSVTTIRKSREGSQKGSAGDSKKAVLNSLLTPLDHSKSPESVNPEEPVLELRWSVTIEREVKVPVCYDRFSLPVGTENRGGSEVEEILTAAHREFGGCAHRCAGKPKRREQDRASLRRRGHTRLGTAEE